MAITLSPKSELLQIASSLLMVQLSEIAEDWNFSSSTPKRDIRKILAAIDKHNNFQRETAIRIKNIYDKLTKIDKEEKFGEWQICPVCSGTGQAMNYRNMIPLTTDTCTRCNGKKTIKRPIIKSI